MNDDVTSSRRRPRRVASYELTVRAENNNALLLVDVQQSSADDLVDMTLVEVTGGHVEVTFFTRKATSFSEMGDSGERVSVRSREVNVDDGDWHRIEIVRYVTYNTPPPT